VTLAAVVEAVRQRFIDRVADGLPLPIVHDNAPEPTTAARWCRLSVETDLPRQVSTVPARFRTTGRLVANLFCRLQSGDAPLVAVLDAMTAAFRGVVLTSPDVHFQPPGFVGVPARSDAWFQRTARVDFFADEVATA
jgi:hypothetical protein